MVNEIVSGTYDKDLDKIIEAISRRRQYLAQIQFMNLSVGDKVKFNSKARPQYLVGQTCQITGKRNKNVVVKLDNVAMAGRFRNGTIVTPITLLEKV